MRCRPSLLLCLVLAVGAPAEASARPAAISGQLTKPGYTVLAIAADGAATSVRARSGRFELRPPAARVTLHLRAPSGIYAGPVIAGRAARADRVIVGIRAGAKLGRIAISTRKGYARVERRPSVKRLDPRRVARAKRAVPTGAGKFGRVLSRVPRNAPPGDRDLDGIPDLLDVDDDGDLILDKLDRSIAARGSAAVSEFHIQSTLSLSLSQTTNANVAGLTQARIDEVLASSGLLMMGIIPGDAQELDCARPQTSGAAGLLYCSTGGTGTLFKADLPPGPPPRFPDEFDADGDGFGTMTPSISAAPGSGQAAMFLRHGASTAQIGTGDLLIQRVTNGLAESEYPGAVQYVFATVPALVSYDDRHGNAAAVAYPVPGTAGPGSPVNGFRVKAPPKADVLVELTFWRPQRRSIGAETGAWTDIGGLNYSAGVGPAWCPQDAFSTTDPSLRPLTNADVAPAAYFGLKDLAADRSADPANRMTFTLNLTRCFAAAGLSFEPGATQTLTVQAIAPNANDSAQQFLSFTRE